MVAASRAFSSLRLLFFLLSLCVEVFVPHEGKINGRLSGERQPTLGLLKIGTPVSRENVAVHIAPMCSFVILGL